MITMQNFNPLDGLTQTIGASSGSSNGITIPADATDVAIYNESGATAFIKFGNTNMPTATLSDYPIPSGGWTVIGKGKADKMAATLKSGSGNIYVTPGYGA